LTFIPSFVAELTKDTVILSLIVGLFKMKMIFEVFNRREALSVSLSPEIS